MVTTRTERSDEPRACSRCLRHCSSPRRDRAEGASHVRHAGRRPLARGTESVGEGRERALDLDTEAARSSDRVRCLGAGSGSGLKGEQVHAAAVRRRCVTDVRTVYSDVHVCQAGRSLRSRFRASPTPTAQRKAQNRERSERPALHSRTVQRNHLRHNPSGHRNVRSRDHITPKLHYPPVDQRRDEAGAEAVVDVDDGDV